jgi:FkbM family methyltransferase
MLIYDVGMHNGDDTHYYLLKGAKVVGVEANPALLSELRHRFAPELEAGQLCLIGHGVSDKEGTFPFYVAPDNAPQSSLVAIPGYAEIHVKVVKLSSIFASYGTPDFAKIDVEHADILVLRDLLNANRVPPHIAVEAHTFDIILLLHQMGFTRFRLVNSRRVAELYENSRIVTPKGSVEHSFPAHSSGPFGEDLPVEWQSIEQVCAQWIARQSLYGLDSWDWYDVHATGLPEMDDTSWTPRSGVGPL